MTIASGIVCSDGLVLFADTEEQQGYTKTHVEELQQYPLNNCRLLIATLRAVPHWTQSINWFPPVIARNCSAERVAHVFARRH